MIFTFSFITGITVGFEFIDDEDDGVSWMIVDLFIARLMFGRLMNDQ